MTVINKDIKIFKEFPMLKPSDSFFYMKPVYRKHLSLLDKIKILREILGNK